MHGDEHARARHNAIANGVAQTDVEIVVGADVAHGGEASHEGHARVDARVQRLFCDRFLQKVESALFPIVRIHHGRCVCASMKPGRSVASPRSIVSAPAGMAVLAPMPAIFPSVTTSKPGVERVLLLPSNIRAAFST